jgi:hypothetical protein
MPGTGDIPDTGTNSAGSIPIGPNTVMVSVITGDSMKGTIMARDAGGIKDTVQPARRRTTPGDGRDPVMSLPGRDLDRVRVMRCTTQAISRVRVTLVPAQAISRVRVTRRATNRALAKYVRGQAIGRGRVRLVPRRQRSMVPVARPVRPLRVRKNMAKPPLARKNMAKAVPRRKHISPDLPHAKTLRRQGARV